MGCPSHCVLLPATAMATEEGVVKFVTSLLGKIVTPGVLHPAVKEALVEAGWDVDTAGLLKASSNPAPVAASTGKKRKKEADGTAPHKETKRRPVTPYQLFICLALDRIGKSPEAPGYKVNMVTDENGHQKEARGGKLTVASGLWARIPEETKSMFTKVFKPLSDILHDESHQTGNKIEKLPERAQKFLDQLPEAEKKQIDQMFVQLANPGGVSGAAAAGGSKPAAAEDSDSDDDSGSDSDSDDEDDDKHQQRPAVTPAKPAPVAAAPKPASAQKPTPATASKPKSQAPPAPPASQPKAEKADKPKEKKEKDKKEKKEKKHKHKDKKQKHNENGTQSS